MNKLHKDVFERAFWTAAEVFLAMWVVTDLQSIQTAAVAAVAAGISVVKSYAVSRVKDGESASVVAD